VHTTQHGAARAGNHRIDQFYRDGDQRGDRVRNNRPEVDVATSGFRPRIEGELTVEKATFRYSGQMMPSPQDVSFSIPVGTTFGVGGKPASSKSTIARFRQGIRCGRAPFR
jgi:ABC-type bacteriocin/lantibiotic exporter with double-glycine peptidase domain